MKNKVVYIVIGVVILILVLVTLFLRISLKTQTTSGGTNTQTSILNAIPFIGSRNVTPSLTGSTAEAIGDTRQDSLIKDEQDFEKQNHPDIFLSNVTPHDETTFSVYSDFKKGSPGHFYFLVYLKGADKTIAKQNFINWAVGKGLSQSTIQSLDIQYFNQ